MRSRSSFQALYFLLFIAALTLNLYQAFRVDSPWSHLYSDMGGYIERAWRIASGQMPLPYDTFYPPGTNYLNALVFLAFDYDTGLRAIAVLQAVMLSLSFLFAGRCTEILFESKKAGTVVFLGCIFFWPLSSLSSFYLAEQGLLFFVFFACYLFLKTARGSASHWRFFCIGLLLACGILIKTQAACAVIAILIVTLFARELRSLRKYLPTLIAAMALPLVAQIYQTSRIMGEFSPYIAANGAYNIYLGQSRRESVGCLDPNYFSYYLFFNNNSYFDDRLLEPEAFKVSVLNRDFFIEQTKQLWRENPYLQLIRSLESVSELYWIVPYWPGRSIEAFRKPLVVFDWLFLILVMLPALHSLSLTILKRERVWQIAFIALPILGISALAFIGQGQPRYLLPYKINFLILSVPAWASIGGNFLKRKKEGSSALRKQ